VSNIDKRFKAWGSEFESKEMTPYTQKRKDIKPVTRLKMVIFRAFLAIKGYLKSLLD
jgi:hypothetical protein